MTLWRGDAAALLRARNACPSCAYLEKALRAERAKVEALRAEADEYYRKLLQLLPLRSKQEAARLGLGAPP